MTGSEPHPEVRLLEESDAPALLGFEEENRALLEATLPPRPSSLVHGTWIDSVCSERHRHEG